MKLYHDYKTLFSFIFICSLFIYPIVFLHAQTAAELNTKISEKNSDIDALEKEIASYQNQLNAIGKQKSSLNSSLSQLDITKKKLNADIAVTQKKIEKTNLEITSLSSQIGTKEGLIANDKSSISSGIRTINEVETESLIEIVLSRDSFTNAWNDIDNIVSVREKVRDRITELKQIKGELEDTKKVTESAKKELESLKAELADQKKIVEQNANEKKRLLAQTKNSEANYQKLLKDKLAKKEAFEKELLEYESQLKFILDPSLLPSGHVLNWPLDSVYITGYFSKTGANKALYSNGFHNGVDFRASVGTPVRAMSDGTILGVGDTDKVCNGASFGKFVFIKYNNGLSSTYGHLSLIKVSQGQKVARGEIVGYSGNTGYSTGPHLHVSVYASSAVKMQYRASTACGGQTYYMPISATEGYLNPLTYLPVYK